MGHLFLIFACFFLFLANVLAMLFALVVIFLCLSLFWFWFLFLAMFRPMGSNICCSFSSVSSRVGFVYNFCVVTLSLCCCIWVVMFSYHFPFFDHIVAFWRYDVMLYNFAYFWSPCHFRFPISMCVKWDIWLLYSSLRKWMCTFCRDTRIFFLCALFLYVL